MGAAGPVGLDYAVFQHEMSRIGIAGDEHTDLMCRLRIIEAAALDHIHKG